MKALTICQPYASLIVGWPGMPEDIRKRVENRTWPTTYRGPLLIHAGKSRKWMDTYKSPSLPGDLPFGSIVGVANLVSCMTFKTICDRGYIHVHKRWPWLCSHLHCEGPWCFILEDIERFVNPISHAGRQGLFDIPVELVTEELSLSVNATFRSLASSPTERI